MSPTMRQRVLGLVFVIVIMLADARAMRATDRIRQSMGVSLLRLLLWLCYFPLHSLQVSFPKAELNLKAIRRLTFTNIIAPVLLLLMLQGRCLCLYTGPLSFRMYQNSRGRPPKEVTKYRLRSSILIRVILMVLDQRDTRGRGEKSHRMLL
jgi:hypothetical protein